MNLNGNQVALRPFSQEYPLAIKEWYYSGEYKYFFRNFTYLLKDTDFTAYEQIINGKLLYIFKKDDLYSPIGLTGLYDSKEIVRSVKLMMMFSKGNEGKGYGKDALDVMKKYVFNTLNFRKLCVHIASEDLKTKNIIEAVGFKYETTLKDECNIDGNYCDELRYTLTK